VNNTGFKLDDKVGTAKFEATVRKLLPALVILDPFYLMFQGDTTKADQVIPVLRYLLDFKNKMVSEGHGFSLILVHHYNKGGDGKSGAAQTGGQRIHGTTFFYYRDDALAAYPGLRRDLSNPAPSFTRRQSGFSLGGPFVQNRLFWFTNIEHNNQDGVFDVGAERPLRGEQEALRGGEAEAARDVLAARLRLGVLDDDLVGVDHRGLPGAHQGEGSRGDRGGVDRLVEDDLDGAAQDDIGLAGGRAGGNDDGCAHGSGVRIR
jgi:hypothetical protein